MDMDELHENRRQNATVTTDGQVEKSKIMTPDEFLDMQVRQSKTSHLERVTEHSSLLKRISYKKGTLVDKGFQDVFETVNENIRQRSEQLQDQFNAAGLLELPSKEVLERAPIQPEMIDASEERIGTTKKLQTEIGHPTFTLVTEQEKYKDAPLFEKMPSLADVQQGRVGDCYFMASIASVVKSDPLQLLKNMKDNGDNTVTVRFFRRRTKRSYNREKQKQDFQAFNDKTKDEAFAQMKPADKLQFLLLKVQYGQLDSKSPTSNFVNDIRNAMPYYCFTLKHGDKSLCDSLMESTDEAATFFQDIAKINTIEGAFQILCTADAKHKNFLKLRWYDYAALFNTDSSKNYAAECPDDQDEVMQEVYVTVSKDLTEREVRQKGGVIKTEPIYAGGPLWARLLEKAYAASGLNQLQGSDADEALTELDRSYAGIEGGKMSDAFRHLTGGKHKRAATFELGQENNTLIRAMEKAFGGVHWEPAVQQEFGLSKTQVDELKKALIAEDHSQLKSVSGTGENYREQEVGLDDLIRVILKSKCVSSYSEEQRRALAFQMSTRLAGSGTCRLQFARFSGIYTDYAIQMLQKIQNKLAKGKPVGASSAVFLPESLSHGGLNGEAIAGGVVEKHSYTILEICHIDDNEFLVLRNPWADGVNVYRRQKDGTVVDELDRTGTNNGVFLIELNDFLRKFDFVEGVSDK